MSLSTEDAKYYEAATAEIAATDAFLTGFLARRKDKSVSVIDAFDGCCAEAVQDGLDANQVLPKSK